MASSTDTGVRPRKGVLGVRTEVANANVGGATEARWPVEARGQGEKSYAQR